MEDMTQTGSFEGMTLKEFQELIEYLDLNSEGENLYIRMWSGGGSYILNDDGETTREFETIYDLVKYLKEMKSEYDSGKLKAVIWE